MKNLLFLLLGAFIFGIIAAGTISVMTVKPETPKSVFVGREYYAGRAIDKIKQYIKKGYVVKTISNGGKDAYVIFVMEKY